MAAKILFVAVAVCAFGALNAEKMILSIDSVSATMDKVLVNVEAKIEEIDALANAAMQTALDTADEQALSLALGWTSNIKVVTDKADALGLNVDECLLEKKANLDILAASVRLAAQACAETQIEVVKSGVATVEALKPQTELIKADAVLKAALCEGKPALARAMCLAKVLSKQSAVAGTSATAVLDRSSKVIADIAVSTTATSECIADNVADEVALASKIVENTTSCVQAKLDPITILISN